MSIVLAHSGAARTARRLVAQCCADAGTGRVASDTAQLLTSELVTNALLHGCGRVRLDVEADASTVRVGVRDDNPRHPRAPVQRDDAEGGRGMLIVAALASGWGVLDTPPGKTVWFDVVAQP